MWAFFLSAALAAASSAQSDCSRGACYPPLGDLLFGREQQLRASSTCGLAGIEVFCSLHGQTKMQCCPCDSQNPRSSRAHTIQDVASSAGTNRWWMSKRDVSPVTVQLDLQRMFQLDTLSMSFKGPRPKALVIERTKDYGRTWQPALFMSTDCPQYFPGVSTSKPRTLQETYCFTLPPTTSNPYLDQTVRVPLRPHSGAVPTAVSGYTGLRVNLTQLGDVPNVPGRRLSRYYAVREMSVLGSCFCHGHASQCLPETTSNQLPTTQVNSRCNCQHNTMGLNCERCADLYNDLPWRPAETNQPNACQRCQCNNHAQRCRFDPARFEVTGRRSGGICESCMHNTAGPNCERCAPNYYPNPRSRMDQPDACLRCSCDAAGALGGGQCDSNTGTCVCKANVEGPNCDRCRNGYYGLSASDPLGCKKCNCGSQGSVPSSCDPVTGQCLCQTGTGGVSCDQCPQGFWKPTVSSECQPCNCDPTNALSSTCDQVTGQCQCRLGFGGRACGGCPDFTYGDTRSGCRPCQCDSSGTATCDSRTGACLCRLGVTGVRCDSCGRASCARFPQCPACPACFFTLDAQLRNYSLTLRDLTATSNLLPGGPSTPGDLGARVHALEVELDRLRNAMPLPPSSAAKLDAALTELNRLKYVPHLYTQLFHQLTRLNAKKGFIQNDVDAPFPPVRELARRLGGDLSALGRPSDLPAQLNELERLLEQLDREYAAKKDATGGSTSPGELQASYWLQVLYCAEMPILRGLFRYPQVCGSTRSGPCTPADCRGDLCLPDPISPCLSGQRCVGALPLSAKALQDTLHVDSKLQELKQKITQASAQVQHSRYSNIRCVRKLNLILQLPTSSGSQTFVLFLFADPTADPKLIQQVSDGVLGVKPANRDDLQKKVEEIRALASRLPNGTRGLNETGPLLDQARRLLQDAQMARIELPYPALVSSSLQVDEQLNAAQPALKSTNDAVSTARNQMMPLTELLKASSDRAGKGLQDAEQAGKVANDSAKVTKSLMRRFITLTTALEVLASLHTPQSWLFIIKGNRSEIISVLTGMLGLLCSGPDYTEEKAGGAAEGCWDVPRTAQRVSAEGAG
uniref:Uncharacterized protein n=1 Tax=Denticeps clupeoides TaxID=299321 RepID=A0AAY4C929_9TELE